MSKAQQETSVLIIGAGISGYAAGTRLLHQGFNDFLILEAENRIGGRIHTIPFSENVIDLGAQWCEGEETTVHKLAKDLLEDSKYDLDYVRFVDIQGNYYPISITREIRNLLNEITEEPNLNKFDGSAGAYVDARFQQERGHNQTELEENIKDWFFKSRLEEEGAESLYDISAKLLSNFNNYPGSQFLTWKDKGYVTILDVLKAPNGNKPVQIDDKILLNKQVVNVLWDQITGDKITVTCADGSIFKADKLLITVSLGVLKDRINTLFTPNLPETKINTIQTLGMGTANKIFLEFKSNWWELLDPNGFNFIWNDTDFSNSTEFTPEDKWLTGIFCFRPIDYQPNILLGWIVTTHASEMERLSDFTVKTKVMQLLRLFLKDKYDIPDPINFLRTKWKSNPNFRGSYSYPAVTAANLNLSALDLEETVRNTDGVPVLYFGGEATHLSSYATVHGALETGWREADKILDDFDNNKTKSNGSKVGIIHYGCVAVIFSLFFFRWL